jgi:hypothetical protein
MVVKQTIVAYRKLTEQQGVKVILAYSYCGLFSIAPLAQKSGVILITPLDCDEDIAKLGENVLCVAKLTEHFGEKMA